MGIANRIFNILVLLVAIGAAVCAFLLFQKREQITKGRKMMAESVVKAVHKIDPSVKISPEDMSIKLPADSLKNPLDVLDKNVNKIFNQRKAIAETLAETTNMVNAMESSMAPDENLEEKDLTSYQTSQAKREAAVATVTKKVEYYDKKNQAVRTGMKSIAAAVRESEIPAEELRDTEKLSTGFARYSAKAEKYTQRTMRYGSHIETVSDKFKFEKRPNTAIDNDSFEDELRLNLENVDAFVAEHERIKAECEKLRKDVEKLTAELKAKSDSLKKEKTQRKALQKELDVAKKEIRRLKHIIDPSSDEDDGESADKKQTDYSIFLRKLVAKVTYVDEKYGFIMFDAGRKSSVPGIGIDGKLSNKPAPIPADALMTVTSSLDPEKAQYVARVQVIKVGENSSIANILPTPGRRLPKPGDLVFFSEADFTQMFAIRELARKKAEEEAAANAPAQTSAKASDAKKEEDSKKDAKAESEDSDDDDEDDEESSESAPKKTDAKESSAPAKAESAKASEEEEEEEEE